MFADTLGRKPVQALHSAYTAAGGGEAGIAAIEKSLDKYMRVTLDPKTEAQNIKDYQESTAAKAIAFQNSLDDIVNTTAQEVLPAMKELGPYTKEAAHALSEVAKFAAHNPGTAIAAAFGLAIAQAGIQATIRLGLEKGLEVMAPTIIAKLGTVFGGIAVAMPVIIAGAIAAAAAHMITKDTDERAAGQTEQSIRTADAMLRGEGYRSKAKTSGTYSAGEQKDLEEINKNFEFRIKSVQGLAAYDKAAGGAPTSDAGIALENLVRPDVPRARVDAPHIEAVKREFEENKRILDMIRTGVLRVEVTNPTQLPGIGGPMVDDTGRAPPSWITPRKGNARG